MEILRCLKHRDWMEKSVGQVIIESLPTTLTISAARRMCRMKMVLQTVISFYGKDERITS